jgi:hypothetical protein
VAHEGTWFVIVADGAPVQVRTAPPASGPTAAVSMSRETFDRLLRREAVPSGERPHIRGDVRPVLQLRAWTERAQGIA